MAIDLFVIGIYFAVILWIGLTKGARETSLEGYALGDRRIPWWAILASILAAEISAATFLGAPGEGYAHRNFTYAQLVIGAVLGRILVAWIFLKPYYEHKVISIYEFLEIRFGATTKNAASMVFLVTRALASGTRLYVAAILLVIAYEMTMGVRPTKIEELGIYITCLVVLVALTALYTAAGGIKAVVWTDVIQACVLVLCLIFALTILITKIPGGLQGAASHLQGPEDLIFFDSGIDANLGVWGNVLAILGSEYTIFAALIGATFIALATHGTDQDMVQRMLTGENHKKGSLAVILSGIIDFPIVMAFLLIGILLWVYYQIHPDPALPDKNPHIFPYFIMHEMPPGVRGLMVAGVLATAMGSLSTALNALATSFCRDWYAPFFRPRAGEREMLFAARVSTVAFAVVLVAIGSVTAWVVISGEGKRILPIVLGIFGYTYGSLLGVFLIGALTKTRGSDAGNLMAMAAGFVVVSVLSGLPAEVLGQDFALPAWVPTLEFTWRVFFGCITTVAVGLLFRTPPREKRHAASPAA